MPQRMNAKNKLAKPKARKEGGKKYNNVCAMAYITSKKGLESRKGEGFPPSRELPQPEALN